MKIQSSKLLRGSFGYFVHWSNVTRWHARIVCHGSILCCQHIDTAYCNPHLGRR